MSIAANFSTNWIINRNTDLIWFIFSSLSAYLLIFMYAGLGWDMVTIWFVWVTFIDSPHFFGTYSRTYFDKVEFSNRRGLLLGSLVVFLIGPITISISYVLYLLGFDGYGIPWTMLVIFFSLWAYWHVVRQHYGFLSLYKKKNNEKATFDYYLDAGLLYSGLLLPFIVFVIKEKEARGLLMGFVEGLTENNMILLEGIVSTTVMSIVSIWALVYIIRQVMNYKNGISVNLPKSLFLLAVIPLHIFICYSPLAVSAGLLGFGAFVTIFHDFQYHAIVWFHHKNRYKGENVRSKFGISSFLASSLPIYIGCAVMAGIIFRVLGCTFQVHPGCVPLVLTSQVHLFGDFNTDRLLLGILFGVAMHHYYLDQKIWKTSKDKQLAKDLKLN